MAEDRAAGAEMRLLADLFPSRFGADRDPAPIDWRARKYRSGAFRGPGLPLTPGVSVRKFEELVLDVRKTWQFEPAQLFIHPFRRFRVKVAHEVVVYFLRAAKPVKARLLTLGRALHIG